jgi:hypothetical protein
MEKTWTGVHLENAHALESAWRVSHFPTTLRRGFNRQGQELPSERAFGAPLWPLR